MKIRFLFSFLSLPAFHFKLKSQIRRREYTAKFDPRNVLEPLRLLQNSLLLIVIINIYAQAVKCSQIQSSTNIGETSQDYSVSFTCAPTLSTTISYSTEPFDSSVLLDWSACWTEVERLKNAYGDRVVGFSVEYSPTCGSPPSPISLLILSPSALRLIINDTLPAVCYSACFVVEFHDGSRRQIYQQTAFSSPLAPTLLSYDTTADSLDVVFAAPQSGYSETYAYCTANYEYYLEYYRLDGLNDEKVQYVSSNSTALRIRNLVPNSQYVLHVYTRLFGVQSHHPLIVNFQTKKLEFKQKSLTIHKSNPLLYHSDRYPHYTSVSSTPCSGHDIRRGNADLLTQMLSCEDSRSVSENSAQSQPQSSALYFVPGHQQTQPYSLENKVISTNINQGYQEELQRQQLLLNQHNNENEPHTLYEKYLRNQEQQYRLLLQQQRQFENHHHPEILKNSKEKLTIPIKENNFNLQANQLRQSEKENTRTGTEKANTILKSSVKPQTVKSNVQNTIINQNLSKNVEHEKNETLKLLISSSTVPQNLFSNTTPSNSNGIDPKTNIKYPEKIINVKESKKKNKGEDHQNREENDNKVNEEQVEIVDVGETEKKSHNYDEQEGNFDDDISSSTVPQNLFSNTTPSNSNGIDPKTNIKYPEKIINVKESKKKNKGEDHQNREENDNKVNEEQVEIVDVGETEKKSHNYDEQEGNFDDDEEDSDNLKDKTKKRTHSRHKQKSREKIHSKRKWIEEDDDEREETDEIEEAHKNKKNGKKLKNDDEDYVVEEDNEEEEDKNEETESTIKVSKVDDGKHLRIEWSVSETALCDEFALNYTIRADEKKSNNTGNDTMKATRRNVALRTTSSFTQIDFVANSIVDVKVSCVFEGAVIPSSWSASREVDLRKPRGVRNVRVRDVATDKNYVASIQLTFDWPTYHDSRFYNIVVAWELGKSAMHSKNTITVGKRTRLVRVHGLLPAQLYTLIVRNVSREIDGLTSTTTGLRQITPPAISSTISADTLASTSIGIRFDATDEHEHRFDHYELICTSSVGSFRNITKIVHKNDRKTFNFTRLTAGRTYRFVLYTVYKGLRSRPVIAEITTYPVKVENFLAVCGPGYAVLHWRTLQFPHDAGHFRLSYSSRGNNGETKKSREIIVNGTTRSYRFARLDYDTYYTFMITVVAGTITIDEEESNEEEESTAVSDATSVTVGFAGRSRFFPILKRSGSRELAITFENDRNTFPDLNGVIDNFAIIVTEDLQEPDDGFELRSWYDVNEMEVRPAYRTSPADYHPFKRRGASKLATFIIGEEDCDGQTSSDVDKQYCNGPLQSQVAYYAKVRAYSVAKVAMETDWVAIHRHTGLFEDNEIDEDSSKRGGGPDHLPCYMYLNGCADENNAIVRQFSKIIVLLSAIFAHLMCRIFLML